MNFVTRNLDGGLESSLGYEVPPNSHSHLLLESRLTTHYKRSVGGIWHATTNILFWLVLVIVVVIVVGVPGLIWIANSEEAKKVSEREKRVDVRCTASAAMPRLVIANRAEQ